MTNEQIQRIYNTKMQNLMNRNARIAQEQDDADRAAFQKQQETYGKISAGLQAANMVKDLRESAMMEMLSMGSGGEYGYTYKEGVPIPTKKYQRKDMADRGWLPEGLLPGGKKPKLGKIGATVLAPLEKTEGYKEFKAKEEAAKELERARKTVPIAGEDEFFDEDITIEDTDFDDFEDWAEAPPTYDSYALSKMLDRSGIKLPEGMSRENRDAIMTALDKVVEEGDAQDYKAFTDTLKNGLDNPDTFQSVVTDLTENTDQTIQSAIDGTYVPEVEDVSTVVETTGLGEIEQWERDLGIEEPGVVTAEELENMPAPAAITLPTPGSEGLGQYGMTPQQKAIQELERKAMPSGVSMQELESKLPSETVPSFREGTLPKTVTAEPRTPKGSRRIAEFDPMGDVDLDVSPELEGAPDIIMESPQLKGAEGAPITPAIPDVEVPDVEVPELTGDKTSLFKKGQTVLQLANIGKTLTDEEASTADKAFAGTQAAKMLTDLAAKKAGQKTASQIGTGAIGSLKGKIAEEGIKKGYKEFSKEGLKLTGKQTAGVALGGVIGGYTMVTEAKEAKESWEEGDYDEAILQGIGSVSGGMQTAGAGMMLTGVGAPLGAVLFGLGSAGSAISGAGQFIESIFGGDGAPEPEKPKFNASQYLNRIRQRRSY